MRYDILWVFLTFVLMMGLLAGGCASFDSRTVATGMGTVYQEDLCATYTVTIQDEEHEAEGAVAKFIGVFENITGIPAAVLGAITSPERAFAEALDGDRKEVVVSFGLADCKDVDIGAIVKDINETLSEQNIGAKAVFTKTNE